MVDSVYSTPVSSKTIKKQLKKDFCPVYLRLLMINCSSIFKMDIQFLVRAIPAINVDV